MIESNCARLGCAAQSRYHRERRIGLVSRDMNNANRVWTRSISKLQVAKADLQPGPRVVLSQVISNAPI